MLRFTKEIFDLFNIRRTPAGKKKFFKKMGDKFYDSGYEVYEDRKLFSKDLIIGDIKKADIIFAARYDTKPTLLFKNYIFPKSKSKTYLYCFLVFSVLNLIALFFEYFYFWITESQSGSLMCYFITMAFFLLYLLFGFSFKGADDNTSSVMALCESILAFGPQELKRKKVAFVFYDRFFKSDKTVIELKKIGNGDILLFMCSEELRKDEKLTDRLIFCIENNEKKANTVTSLEKTVYKSLSSKTMIISSFFQNKKGVLYSKNSRTLWDNTVDETNIALISEFIKNIVMGF